MYDCGGAFTPAKPMTNDTMTNDPNNYYIPTIKFHQQIADYSVKKLHFCQNFN